MVCSQITEHPVTPEPVRGWNHNPSRVKCTVRPNSPTKVATQKMQYASPELLANIGTASKNLHAKDAGGDGEDDDDDNSLDTPSKSRVTKTQAFSQMLLSAGSAKLVKAEAARAVALAEADQKRQELEDSKLFNALKRKHDEELFDLEKEHKKTMFAKEATASDEKSPLLAGLGALVSIGVKLAQKFVDKD